MKDYYYFLGVEKEASDEEIRRAYRKLSLKYHPDKNPGDDFFERRFREVQEAYEQLIDKEKRDFFDSQSAEPSKKFRTDAPPVIRSFSANKIRVKKGDEIILNWDTANADLVKILPFGLEKSSGEKSFRITEFKGGQFHAVLQATNTLINKSVVQGITFTEIFDLNSNKDSTEKKYHQKPNANNWFSRSRIVACILIFVALIMAVLFIFQR